jgi:predicted polyphosphate/ATP-dependent NAD kinase
MTTVGIIANPAAGQDIRRLVAHGWNVPAHEKVNILRRVFVGLEAAGVKQIIAMPDVANLCAAARGGASDDVGFRLLEMSIFNDEGDTGKAVELMAETGVACVVTLGGDGTNRAVAGGLGDIPLVPISTGTNNVFPTATEGTVAGLAAGLLACGLVDADTVTARSNVLEIQVEESAAEVALIDLAISKERFVGARAIWDMSTVHEIFLSRAEPASIGLSAIGAALPMRSMDGRTGLHVRLGPGGRSVVAPVGPGLIRRVPVSEWSALQVDVPVEISLTPCTIALDGERSLTVRPGQAARVCLRESGPRVVDPKAAIREASRAGIFTDGTLKVD